LHRAAVIEHGSQAADEVRLYGEHQLIFNSINIEYAKVE